VSVVRDTPAPLLQAALQYASRGWSVLPVRPGGKEPLIAGGVHAATTDRKTIEGWWSRWPTANVGIACGTASGLVVVDADDPQVLKRLAQEGRHLPPAPTVRTARGVHLYFACPAGGLRSRRVCDGVEVKAEGAYVLAPPSRHPCGALYHWVVEPGGELPALPPWILEEANQKQAAPFELPPEIYSGERNNTLTRLAGALRRKGIRPDEILETLRAVNRARCRPPLHDSELEQIARSAARWAPGEVETKQATLEDHARPSLLNLAQVQPARVRWLWPGRLPLGKLAILDGLPGVGKSLVQIDIIARVTTGRPMPDGGLPDRAEPGNVVLLTAEDDLADTVVPRLLAAGADLKRVVALRGVLEPDGTERWATLKDLQVLREAVLDTQAVLVAVDPLAAYISARMARDEEVRERLGPLARLAEDAQATVWAIRHLNKQVALTDPILRGGGSIGIIGAARAGLLAAFDPGDPEGERRVLAVTKTNLARRVASLAYRVVEADGVPAVEWLGRSDHTARSLLRAQAEEPEERAALQEAVEFLVEALAQGPRPAEEVLREAQQAGLAERTVRRARAVARVVSRRVGGLGGAGRWVWALPDQAVKEASPGPKVAVHEGFGHLRRVESPELRRDAGLAKTAKLDELGHLSEQPAPPPVGRLRS
jgi:hypothetical protein